MVYLTNQADIWLVLLRKSSKKGYQLNFKFFLFKSGRKLFEKLPKLPNRYAIIMLCLWLLWKTCNVWKFQLVSTIKDALYKLLKIFEVTKARGIDQISGKFLKDGTRILKVDQKNDSTSVNKILYDYQFRFGKKHSIDKCLSSFKMTKFWKALMIVYWLVCLIKKIKYYWFLW